MTGDGTRDRERAWVNLLNFTMHQGMEGWFSIQLDFLPDFWLTISFRTLEELKTTKEFLKGQESQRLRTFCTSNCMEPGRDLDSFGKLLMTGTLDELVVDYAARMDMKIKSGMEPEGATQAVANDLYSLRWGPIDTPIFNLLGLFTLIIPDLRPKYISFADFFINAKVPVDGRDLSGSTALSHCYSTKPGFDLEYAQLLYKAGGDVNNRNRYGTTTGHEIVQVYNRSNPASVQTATKALEWFLSHGGNVDIADGDGISPRNICTAIKYVVPQLLAVIEKEDPRRALKGNTCCSLCGLVPSVDEKLLICGKCKKGRYCNPKLRACQKLDWPKHKKECKA
jgi:hypothetical protein